MRIFFNLILCCTLSLPIHSAFAGRLISRAAISSPIALAANVAKAPHSLADLHPPVLGERKGPLLLLKLNRPKAMHALNYEIVYALISSIYSAQHDPSIWAIGLDSTPHPDPDRGHHFCAGGDIKTFRQNIIDRKEEANVKFLSLEYLLNRLLQHHDSGLIPIIARASRSIFGGGAGLFLPIKYRVMDPYAKIDFPETSIGAFPDVFGILYAAQAPLDMSQQVFYTKQRASAVDALDMKWTDYVSDAQPDEFWGHLVSFMDKTAHQASFQSQIGKYLSHTSMSYEQAASYIDPSERLGKWPLPYDCADQEFFSYLDKDINSPTSALETKKALEWAVPQFAYGNITFDDIAALAKNQLKLFCDLGQLPDFLQTVDHLLVQKGRGIKPPWKYKLFKSHDDSGYEVRNPNHFIIKDSEELIRFFDTFYQYRSLLPTIDTKTLQGMLEAQELFIESFSQRRQTT